MMNMQNKAIWKILVISIALLMVVSCATPSFAVDNHLTNNASKQLNDVFSPENITADNTPFLLSLRRLHL
jgi:uncharacterized lipoprotein YajG